MCPLSDHVYKATSAPHLWGGAVRIEAGVR